MNLQEKKTSLETLLNDKSTRLQQIENAKQQVFNECLELQGQIKLVNELIVEESRENQKPDITTVETKKYRK